ncbi:VOC family protein [Amnibacterium endophyticum]|uniref:VOC family protein n=1 Tax=Amnibacterium endophyticum TaxID=2109337 RepID=UPI00366E0198
MSITTTDVPRARAFYEALGFEVDPRFSDETAVCVVLEEHVFLMVLAREVFASMTDKPVADPRTHALVGLNVTRSSREEVDETVARGLAAGGTEPGPAQEHGSMYVRDLEDPDGNNLGFLFMGEPEEASA